MAIPCCWTAIRVTTTRWRFCWPLVATGPLTNIAALLLAHPEAAGRLREIVVMGGSTERGNVTPYAEFNIHTDPEAAAIVVGSGLPVTMCGLV
jgi:inosine-uridine nucleoside N-ribohydrolase